MVNILEFVVDFTLKWRNPGRFLAKIRAKIRVKLKFLWVCRPFVQLGRKVQPACFGAGCCIEMFFIKFSFPKLLVHWRSLKFSKFSQIFQSQTVALRPTTRIVIVFIDTISGWNCALKLVLLTVFDLKYTLGKDAKMLDSVIVFYRSSLYLRICAVYLRVIRPKTFSPVSAFECSFDDDDDDSGGRKQRDC